MEWNVWQASCVFPAENQPKPLLLRRLSRSMNERIRYDVRPTWQRERRVQLAWTRFNFINVHINSPHMVVTRARGGSYTVWQRLGSEGKWRKEIRGVIKICGPLETHWYRCLPGNVQKLTCWYQNEYLIIPFKLLQWPKKRFGRTFEHQTWYCHTLCKSLNGRTTFNVLRNHRVLALKLFFFNMTFQSKVAKQKE